MAFKIFLDTNIFLDHFSGRNMHSVKVLALCESGQVEGYTSSASFFTLAYIIQERVKTDPRPVLSRYASFLETIETTKENLLAAFDSSFKDLEDAFQFSTACNEPAMKYFVTNNVKEFKLAGKQPQVITPESFIKLWKDDE